MKSRSTSRYANRWLSFRIFPDPVRRWVGVTMIISLMFELVAPIASAAPLSRIPPGGAPWGPGAASAAASESASGPVGGQGSGGGKGPVTSPIQANQAATQSLADFSAAARAIVTQQSAQTAARLAALNGPNNLGVNPNNPSQQLPNVPNGLGPGGLQVAPGISDPNVWQGANAPTQTTSNGQTTVTIQQTASKAILTWTTFNVGMDTTVYFNQSAGNTSSGNNWIALNRIIDPSGVPSQILGQIKGEGTIYLINANGIIFGGSSQVNTSSLIASSLSFLGDGATPNLTPGSAAWDAAVGSANGTFLAPAQGVNTLNAALGVGAGNLETNVIPTGDITVDAGALISTASLGYVVLAGQNVNNAGSIMANNGTAILAGGVGFSFINGNGSTNLPNISVVGGEGDPNTPVGSVTNTGLIEATTGAIDLIGYSVTQGGVAVATTSTTRPGSILIQGQDETHGLPGDTYLPGRIGPVTLGPDSVTAILPEEDGDTTPSSAAATAAFQTGSITISGYSVWVQGSTPTQSGALIEAPGANVSIAGIDDTAEYKAGPNESATQGRVELDSGSTIDVSGLADVELPIADTLVTIGPITVNDVADEPLQRNSFLISSTIVIDSSASGTNAETGESWVGTPLINDGASYTALVPRGIDQMLVNGGTVNLEGTQIITQAGSNININGGYISYQGGLVNTTELIDANGQLVPIGEADPDTTYLGIAGETVIDHPHWGVTQTYENPLEEGRSYYEAGYIVGGNAGTLNIFAGSVNSFGGVAIDPPGVILDGNISARAFAGQNQVATGSMPKGGSFLLDSANAENLAFPEKGASTSNIVLEDTPPNLDSFASDFTFNTPLTSDQWNNQAPSGVPSDSEDSVTGWSAISGTKLSQAGFSSVSLNSLGDIVVQNGSSLNVQPGGNITLNGASVTILGSLTAHAGTIAVNSLSNRDITVGSGAVLDASGEWVNDSGLGATDETGSEFVNGGSISLTTGISSQFAADGKTIVDTSGIITLDSGSLLNVSSGGRIGTNGQLQMANGLPIGKGGSITLSVGGGAGGTFDPSPPSTVGFPSTQPTRAKIVMDGTILGYGFAGGGTLTLDALGFQIGGDPAAAPSWAMYLPANYFADQGFGSYVLGSVFDATVAANTVVPVTQEDFLPTNSIFQAPTGSNLYTTDAADPAGIYATVGTLDSYLRPPTNLSISGGGSYQNINPFTPVGAVSYPDVAEAVTLGEGAVIEADPGANISLNAANQLTVLGSIIAPGGSITLEGGSGAGYNNAGTASLWLGPDSVLDVSGVAIQNPFQLPVLSNGELTTPQTGRILGGGTVTLTDPQGYIVAVAGSVINASGASATFEIPEADSNTTSPISYTSENVWSNAGSITLAGVGLLFDGTLEAHAGDPAGQGGTLTIGSNSGSSTQALFQGLIFQQGADTAPGSTTPAVLVPARLNPGGVVATVDPTTVPGYLTFDVDRLNGSGITTLQVVDPIPVAVAFSGNVNLSLGQAFIANASEFVALPAGSFSIPTLKPGQSSVNGTTVTITAPYVDLTGESTLVAPPANPTQSLADGVLNINASQIDMGGEVILENFGQANFTSSGAIRFVTPFDANSNGLTNFTNGLFTSGNLTFQAAELYPATDNSFIIDAYGPTVSGQQIATTITFLSNGPSSTPLSAGGSLYVDATTINQDGAIYVPSGSLILGVGDPTDATTQAEFQNLPLVATQNVNLNAGSVTSVSLGGLTIPYGTTVDGVDWQYDPFQGSNPATDVDLTAPPAKIIEINGANLALNPGATVDISGGGDLQAEEFVAGNGGSRNVLQQFNTSFANSTTGTQIPLYPDARGVYAVIPGYNGPVAPYDPVLDNGQAPIGVGQAVYLSGIPGLPPGVYTLLPAEYATLPGAYRVVQETSATTALPGPNTELPDGTYQVAGYFTNALTGAHNSQTTDFYVQSGPVWKQYSQYTLTSANSFFTEQALNAPQPGTVVPPLPVDAGQLVLGATKDLSPGAQILTDSGVGGRGAEIDIASQDIQIIGTGEAALPGYLQISASSLDDLDAASLLIGGTRTATTTGITINAVATGVIIDNDAADPLTGSEIIVVSAASPTDVGIQVDSGSVITAQGSIASNADEPITIGNATPGSLVSGDGSLLRVSDGAPVSITRLDLPSNSLGNLTVQGNVTLSGGQALTLDSSGNTTVDPSAVLSANSINADAGTITFINGNSATGISGLVIGSNTLEQFANSQQVTLSSYGMIDFEGNITVDVANGLTLSAANFASGADGQSGNVSITAGIIGLTNDLSRTPAVGSSGMSTLTLSANEIDFGTSGGINPVTSKFNGFGSIIATAQNGIVGQGANTFDFGAMPVTLTAPVILADTNASAKLETTGAFVIDSSTGTPLSRQSLGGAITLIGGTLSDNGNIIASSGNVSLEATTGDLTVSSGATINTAGIARQFFDQTEYAPGGAIALISDEGNVNAESGSTLNFSGATGGGNAGSLTVSAPLGSATLAGALQGQGNGGGTGGSFSLTTGSSVDLDTLAPFLNAAGVTGSILIQTNAGDLDLTGVLTGSKVELVANDGFVNIVGTINASGAAGGEIDLYGEMGVTLTGALLAEGSDPTQLGGTVNIGTAGTPTANSYNATYGYENVSAANAGVITLGSSAIINVSGGSAETLATDGLTGGTVTLRTPLLSDGSINVNVAMTDPSTQVVGARSVNVNAYAVWDTTDQTTGAQHFDGIIDPAGSFDSAGNAVTTANANHVGFYQTTLMGFVQAPRFTNEETVAALPNITVTPEMDLVNSSANVNGGAISVLTNWNLGAGSSLSSLDYRYHDTTLNNTVAPTLVVRALGNINVDASITDGFYENTALTLPQAAQGPSGPTSTFSAAENAYLADKNDVLTNISFDPNFGGGSLVIATVDPNTVLEIPQSGESAAYYGNYLTYATDFTRWFGDIKTDDNGFLVPIAAPATTIQPPNLANFTTYSAYESAYLLWLSGFPKFNVKEGTPPAPTAPTSVNLAGDTGTQLDSDDAGYMTAYGTYLITANGNFFDHTTFASLYIYAPAVPPVPGPNQGNQSSTPPLVAGNSSSNMPTATNPLPLDEAQLVAGPSSSYMFVAGANPSGVDPLALAPVTTFASGSLAGQGNLNLDGHVSYVDAATNAAIAEPTMIRTGTGAISIAVGNDFNTLDQTAPGVIYTAGTPDPSGASSTGGPTLLDTPLSENVATGGPEYVVSPYVNPWAAGNISIDAQNSITFSPTVQTWVQWMETGNQLVRVSNNNLVVSSSINFGSFDQGVMSVGGNVTITAGDDITNLSVSLPTTWYNTGSTNFTSQSTGVTSFATVGAGSLVVSAGGNLLGGDYFVANGVGNFTSGGQIEGSTFGLLNATDSISARQSVNVANLLDPSQSVTSIDPGFSTANLIGSDSMAYSETSGVFIESTTGNIDVGVSSSGYKPPTVELVALNGGITFEGGTLYSSPTGELSLIASQSINLIGATIVDDTSPSLLPSPLLQDGGSTISQLPIAPVGGSASTFYEGLEGGGYSAYSAIPMHTGDSDPVRIYSSAGNIVDDGAIEPDKQALIYAGGNIVNLAFYGQNLSSTDVSRIVAGRDIYDSVLVAGASPNGLSSAPGIELSGPGTLDVEAGRNIGPLNPSGSGSSGGIQTVGNAWNPYLPNQSASIDVLFGVGPGINTAGFANAYLNPNSPNADLPNYSPQLVAFMEPYEGGTTLTPDQAWSDFQALPSSTQQLLVDQIFTSILNQTGADYNNSSSPFFHQYSRGYSAINTLFPASDGYTANDLSGGGNGANKLVSTGTLDMRASTIQTQEGGNITILGPGGSILVGSEAAPPIANGLQHTQGILTLEGGNISTFTDQDVLVAQSRIMTEQSGSIVMWSSNGNLNAGQGAKTTASLPTITDLTDPNFFKTENDAGLITGAGIATLQTLPGVPPGNLNLVAPRGTVDAGSAGLRVSGNLNIAALTVANAFNIQVQGTTSGVPTAATVDVSGLSTASNASAAVDASLNDLLKKNQQPGDIDVEIVSFGE